MPNSVAATAQTQTIWTYLLNLFQTEKDLGSAGRLATLQDIRKSNHFWTKESPVLGVQPLRWNYTGDYGQRQREIEIQYLISVGAFSQASETRPSNLDDALAALQPLLADDSGNGVEAIMHDPANLTLGGLSTKTNLSSCQYDWQIRSDADQRTWAFGVYILKVQTIVTV